MIGSGDIITVLSVKRFSPPPTPPPVDIRLNNLYFRAGRFNAYKPYQLTIQDGAECGNVCFEYFSIYNLVIFGL